MLKKEEPYFNFGLLLSIGVILCQFLLRLISKMSKNAFSDIFVLSVPALIVIALSFVFYKKKKCFLRVEQYLIALIPIAFFLVSGWTFAYKDYLPMHIGYAWLILFLIFFSFLKISLNSLILKFQDQAIAGRLSIESWLYFLSYISLMWFGTLIF